MCRSKPIGVRNTDWVVLFEVTIYIYPVDLSFRIEQVLNWIENNVGAWEMRYVY